MKTLITTLMLVVFMGCSLPEPGSIKVVTTASNGSASGAMSRSVIYDGSNPNQVESLMIGLFNITIREWKTDHWSNAEGITNNTHEEYEFNPSYRSVIDCSNVEAFANISRIDMLTFEAIGPAAKINGYWFGDHKTDIVHQTSPLPSTYNYTSTPDANAVNWSLNRIVDGSGNVVTAGQNIWDSVNSQYIQCRMTVASYRFVNHALMGSVPFIVVPNAAAPTGYDVFVNGSTTPSTDADILAFCANAFEYAPYNITTFIPMEPIAVSVTYGQGGYPILDQDLTLVFTVDLNNLVSKVETAPVGLNLNTVDENNNPIWKEAAYTVDYTQDSIGAPITWALGIER